MGETGRIYGIDMTEEMLKVARTNASLVAEKLGYNNIEFKQGFLEAIPVDNTSIDLVTSNCVINLSTKKKRGFQGNSQNFKTRRTLPDFRHYFRKESSRRNAE